MKPIPRPGLVALAVLSPVLSSIGLAAEDAHHKPFKHHAPGVFLGVSDERGGGDDFTWGLEYEYLFNKNFGIGLTYENTDKAHDGDGVEVAVASAYYHPYAGWRLGIGAGTEKIHGHHRGYENLYRVGVAYDFHVGNFGVAPNLILDRVDGENILVYGLSFLYPF